MEKQIETKLYKKRWFILALLFWLNFSMIFTYVNFGFVNNIIVSYFDTTYAAVDWTMLGYNL